MTTAESGLQPSRARHLAALPQLQSLPHLSLLWVMAAAEEERAEQQLSNASTTGGGIPQLGFSFATAAGPGIAAGIVMSAIFYAKSSIDLKRNMRTALRQKS